MVQTCRTSSSFKPSPISWFLSSVLCGGEELSGVQAETERSRLQVLPNQQQIAGQPLQHLHHQQGDTCSHKKKKKSQSLFIPHKTLDIEIRKRVALQYFCLPRLAGSRQTATGCRYQSAKSCCFQRCGKCVFVFIFTACVGKKIKIKCLLNGVLGYRMTVNRPSFWLWQSSTSSQFSWYPSTGIF